jgi:hypothetical protein
VAIDLLVLDDRWGRFGEDLEASGTLAPVAAGGWATHESEIWAWAPTGTPDRDATTPIACSLDGGRQTGTLTIVWDADSAPLDRLEPGGAWPGAWRIDVGDDAAGTTWHLWDGAASGALPAGALLVATGGEYAGAGAWPDIVYGNGAQTRLTSPPLGTAIRWLDLVHAVDLELLHPGVAVDGVGLAWVHDGGYETPAVPVDGWDGTVEGRAQHALSGHPTFARALAVDGQGRPLWSRDVLPLPDAAIHGPGPWRLRLELATSPLFRARGWLVRPPVASSGPSPTAAFPVQWADDQLRWEAPGEAPAGGYRAERSADGGQTWSTAAVVPAGEPLAVARELLGIDRSVRTLLRVVALGDPAIVSRPVAVAAAAAVRLDRPRPNPATDLVILGVDGAGDDRARLTLYDLRGRRLRTWNVGGTPTTVTWDGRDDAGRRLAAGVYAVRLRAAGTTVVRRVTWIP